MWQQDQSHSCAPRTDFPDGGSRPRTCTVAINRKHSVSCFAQNLVLFPGPLVTHHASFLSMIVSSSYASTTQSHSLPPARYSTSRIPARRHTYKLQAHAGNERTPKASVREWRQYNRYLRYQKADHLPRVSWSRYHLSVLFVDK